MGKYVSASPAKDIPPGEKKIVEVDGVLIVLVNLDGQFYAIEDVCTHDGGPHGRRQVERL